MSTNQRSCPICDAGDAQELFLQSFEGLTGSLVDGYEVVCCNTCGFAFASGLPSADEFANYYANMSRYESETAYFRTAEDQARCELIVDLIEPLASDRDTPVLDVGCSTGALLAAFKRRGYGDLEGLDPSPGCADYARKTYGISVLTGTAGEVADLPPRYGLIILSAVLEHLLDPRQVLRDAWGAMVEGGLLFAEVPDAEGFAECARAPFQEFSVEHINFFTPASLTSLLGAAGFEPVTSESRRLPWLSGSLAPTIHAVFRKTGSISPPVPDIASKWAILAYIEASEQIEADVRARIEELADRGAAVLVWGVGTHTRHLLQSGVLDRLQVAAWVDSDPKYQETKMRGISVLAPTELTFRNEPILVSSGTVHHEILRQIRDDLQLGNEVVLLYE